MSVTQLKLKRVTHQDIAREAGVSRVTVSLVLAGKDQTSTDTRKRVLQAAERLRYRPNLLVHGMQTGKSGMVGVIVPASMQFQGQIAHGIHDELLTANVVPLQLMIPSSSDAKPSLEATDLELQQVHRLVDRRVDGVIIWPADASVADLHFREIWQRNIPLVTVDRETTTHADHVGTDEELGGKLVAEHLLSLGHRQLAHVTYPYRAGSLGRRRDAFRQNVQSAGASCSVVEAIMPDLAARIREALSQKNRPTAMSCATDPIAVKVYSIAFELGLRIPQDLSVVGYADFSFSADLIPPLTTIRQDPYQMGRTAARILLKRISGEAQNLPPQRVYLKPELIVRASTGPVAKGR